MNLLEYHVTIADFPEDVDKIVIAGVEWKVTRLELNGVKDRQVMLTYHGYTMPDLHNFSQYDVLRFKCECAAQQIKFVNDGRYYECHIKVKDSDEVKGLKFIGMVVSRNVRREGERFLNLRCYKCSYLDAASRVLELVLLLMRRKVSVLDIEFECVLQDSNLGLDNGWQ